MLEMGAFHITCLVAAYVACVAVLWAITVFSYRLLLHPLRAYPGPLFAKLTDLYGSYFALSKRLHLITYQNHLKYGRVIRQGPNKLVFNSVEALHDIYDNERVVKSHVYSVTQQAPNVYNLFNVIDRRVHKHKRRLIGQVTGDRSMRIFEPTMIEQIDVFIDQLSTSSKSSHAVNMTTLLKRLGNDIVSLLAFGYPLNTQVDLSHRAVEDGAEAANYYAYNRMQFPLWGIREPKYLLLVLNKGWKTRMEFRKTLRNMILARVAKPKDAQHDLYSIVGDAMDSGDAKNLRLGAVWSEAVFFFPAGSDTTATVLSALFFYLSGNQQSYRKLSHEIRSTFESDEEIRSGPKLASCTYLRACIDESLRISPPVGGTLWREAATSPDNEPLIIDGHVIPPGTQFGVNMYTIHHNEEYFPDPFAFKPERWILGEEESKRTRRDAFSPFSIGYRGCAGKPMAYLEASLVMAKTFWNFDFERAPGKLREAGAMPERPEQFQLHDVLTSSHNGPMLVFRPRKNDGEG
ncbi:cytochrome P450 [Annulohypoxylon moriforme]|nr:cytochrome P450 [Annulohypoxylon moriforme]